MTTRRKLAQAALSALAVVLLAVVAAALWLRSSGRPARDGEHSIAGSSAPVEVRWDAWGVPHLRAESVEDLVAAQGFVHAGDRFTQMELGRRAAAGRLSELLGEPTFEIDVYFRQMRFPAAVETLWRDASPESKRLLEAYARGVNAWLEARGSDLPPGLRLLGAEPEPWRPQDSLAFVLLMARDLSFWNDRPEEERLRQASALGLDALYELLDVERIAAPPAVLFAGAEPRLPFLKRAKQRRRAAPPLPPPVDAAPGSNNWALSGERTASGKAMTANDPHLPLFLPSVWYQVHLRSPQYEAAGMSIPGAPGVVLGRGPAVGWAFTNTMLDDHDLFLEDHPDGTVHVRRGRGQWTKIESAVETIRLRGGEEREVQVRWTDIGPFFPADVDAKLPARSLAWTAYAGGDPIAALIGLAAAASPDELFAAAASYVAPAQNLVASFPSGEIAFTVLGAIPERGTSDGRLFASALDPEDRWRGLRPREENPRAIDPPEGLLVTANNDITPPDYALPLNADFFPPHRADRIREVLAARRDWTWQGMAELQTDVKAGDARAVLAALEPDAPALGGDARRAYDVLAAWDGALSLTGAARGPAVLYTFFARDLVELCFADEAEVAELRPFGKIHLAERLLAGDMSEAWFDDQRTEDVETRADIVSAALASAWRTTVERFGDDPADWDYGEIHQLVLRHRLDAVPLLGRWMRRGPYPVPGGVGTVNALAGRWTADGQRQEIAYGPSMRWITDWSTPDMAWAVLPGGQAGHPADAHYDDQIELFLRGELRPAPWSEEKIEAATVQRMTLVP